MNNMADHPEPARPVSACPICSEPAVRKYRPFCSKRCADIDLGRWFGERYVIEGSDSAPEDETDDS